MLAPAEDNAPPNTVSAFDEKKKKKIVERDGEQEESDENTRECDSSVDTSKNRP